MKPFEPLIRGLLLDLYLVGVRCAAPLGMRTLRLSKLLELIASAPTTNEARARVAIARSEAIARHLRIPNTCLYRAMARFVALRSAGLAPAFAMGVLRDAPEHGHAWVELAGVPVDEAIDPRLATTFRFPSRATEGELMEERLRANKDVLLTELGNGTGVLLHLRTKFYFTLNATGVAVWKTLENPAQGVTRTQIADALSRQFQVDSATAMRDLDPLLKELITEELVAHAP